VITVSGTRDHPVTRSASLPVSPSNTRPPSHFRRDLRVLPRTEGVAPNRSGSSRSCHRVSVVAVTREVDPLHHEARTACQMVGAPALIQCLRVRGRFPANVFVTILYTEWWANLPHSGSYPKCGDFSSLPGRQASASIAAALAHTAATSRDKPWSRAYVRRSSPP